MSSNKAALKAAKTALDAEKWDEAITQAQVVLASDSQNYFAKLFLGRAFEKQGKLDDAANSYHSAAKIKPDDQQAWQGLCSLYESQASKKLDEFGECSVQLAGIFAKADDKHRCQTVIDKLIAFAKQNGTTEQYKRALMVLLPGSTVYDFLEGRIQHPSHTFTRLAELTEDEEKQRINKEIGERRTRLGARIGQVTAEVKREVYGTSDLEHLYQNIIDWTQDDEIRREYEEKIFQRAYDTLVILPTDQKESKRNQVVQMARGMVIVKHQFRMAWDTDLEWKDIVNIQDLDVNVLREYIEFYPESGLSKVLRAYLDSEVSPFPQMQEQDQDDVDKEEALTPEDRLLLMGEGLGDGKTSALAHRLVAEYYLHLEEYEGALETARNGLKIVASEEQKTGLILQDNRDALNSALGTSLVHFQSPRNHPEAKTIFDEILARKAKSTAALIGLGLILEEQEHYDEAERLLSQALSQDPDNVEIGAEAAWCNALSGNHAEALEALEKYLPNMKLDTPKARDLRAQTLYRIGVCLWELDPSKAARKDRNGAYARFLSAIKTNVNFAPAYASLGFYYADYARDKKRARQCFQKAFELSASEVESAERLARAFADQGEWDIVEIVSQRVVDSGKVRPPPGSKKKGISWPYSALGVVQMTKQEYAKAIVSFLSALRISPNDYHSYVGLGESYHNSGRYNSASRTFHYAEEPHDGVKMNISGESWFTEYMLANVHRELGEYKEAIEGLEKVLENRPEEFGVLIALLQTFVETAWRCIETGFFGQAADSANMALDLAIKVAELRPSAFNLWKAVGDACSIFAWVQASASAFPVDTVKRLLAKGIEMKEYDLLADIDGVKDDLLEESTQANGATDESPAYLRLSLLAFKRAIYNCAHDIHAQAVAWYNLGWAEEMAYKNAGGKAGKKYLRAAVRCFKRAIELEAGNSEFWNALGVVTTKLNPQVAQHAFVRSLYLNERGARVWANLGVLYIISNDYELAHQAFARAQSTDPDYAHAWMGEGLIALLMGDAREALSHFTHAFDISDASSLITKHHYAVSVFDNLLASAQASSDLPSLIQPLFALQQLRSQRPSDTEYMHLAALYLERISDHDSAITSLISICESAESTYEATESLASLARFALAKADLARNQLAAHDYASALDSATTSLDLSAEASESGLDPEERRKSRLSAHLTAGLAAFKLTDMDVAISSFRAALEESNADPDVVCLLVQVLWAKGGTEEKTVAREQLFGCVETHAEHVGSVVLLGAISALDGDTDTMDAVRDDLVTLRASEKINNDQRTSIERILAAIAALNGGDGVDEAQMALVQTAIMLAPHASLGWSEMAELTDEVFPAQMALLTAQRAVPPFGDLDAEGLAKAFAGAGTAGDAQRAIMLAPWKKEGWEAFTEALSV